jgi:nuclear pore complex protein Nup98-Nup96
MSTPFQTAQPAQSSGTFAFSNFGQTQPVQSSGASAFSNFGQTQPDGQFNILVMVAHFFVCFMQ